ncbi:MAG: ATP-binding protein [Methanosarcinales archaeon]
MVKDDGSGMSEKELMESLNIGLSSKTEEDTGWRGIGIWSGVPACKRIVIITKKMNDKKYRIEIDNNKIRDGIVHKQSLLDILTRATGDIEEITLGADESFEEDHFTMVRLESILRTQKNVFG